MRARRLLILLMMLLLLPQAQAERLTLYTRPGQVDEATPFQLRPTEPVSYTHLTLPTTSRV